MLKWPKLAVKYYFMSQSHLFYSERLPVPLKMVSCVPVQLRTHTHTTHNPETWALVLALTYYYVILEKLHYILFESSFPSLKNGASPFFDSGFTGL